MSTSTDAWIAAAEAESFDIMLAEYDCVATQAHVLMLCKQHIMSGADAANSQSKYACKKVLVIGFRRPWLKAKRKTAAGERQKEPAQ